MLPASRDYASGAGENVSQGSDRWRNNIGRQTIWLEKTNQLTFLTRRQLTAHDDGRKENIDELHRFPRFVHDDALSGIRMDPEQFLHANL
jgi:hypothetical protein